MNFYSKDKKGSYLIRHEFLTSKKNPAGTIAGFSILSKWGLTYLKAYVVDEDVNEPALNKSISGHCSTLLKALNIVRESSLCILDLLFGVVFISTTQLIPLPCLIISAVEPESVPVLHHVP